MKNEISSVAEHKLIDALAGGDQDAFRHIIDLHRLGVVRVCRGLVSNNEDAEDIAQEVFIELYRSASRIRGEAKISTWLYRVAVNKSLNHIRSGKSVSKAGRTSINNGLQIEAEGQADSDLTAMDHREALHAALQKLPGKQRTAFVLQQYQELNYDEIADVMKLSKSSIESLLFRARKNLQKSLRKYYEKNMK